MHLNCTVVLKAGYRSGAVVLVGNPRLGKQKQEGWEFEVSLGFTTEFLFQIRKPDRFGMCRKKERLTGVLDNSLIMGIFKVFSGLVPHRVPHKTRCFKAPGAPQNVRSAGSFPPLM